jgi:hypothetical protein
MVLGKLDIHISPGIKINSKWIKELKLSLETTTGKYKNVEDRGKGNYFLSSSPITQETR